MKTNEQLQKDVQDAIAWEPLLHEAEIGVIVKDGLVTLTGTVNSYPKKMEAEEAAKHVLGVKAVITSIEVIFGDEPGVYQDEEIASEAVRAIKCNWEVPENDIYIRVEHGWVTLEGELQCSYQKTSASNSIKNLPGVRGIINNIEIKKETQDLIEKIGIESAYRRSSALSGLNIIVEVATGKVVLSGVADTIYQKAEAERIAWNAPGVTSVVNNLSIANLQSFWVR